MSEPVMDATPERAEARRVKALYAATIADARANGDLTAAARARTIRDLHAEQINKLNALREAEQKRLGAEHEKLRRHVFSAARVPFGALPSEAISVRDANDRAQRCRTPQEAADLLGQAEMSGDKTLAAAVAQYAEQRGGQPGTVPGQADAWNGVVREFLAARPQLQDTVEQLADIEDLLTPPENRLLDPFNTLAPPEARRASFGEGSVGGDDSRPSFVTRGL